nr:hypothetical protein [Halomonas elongata]
MSRRRHHVDGVGTGDDRSAINDHSVNGHFIGEGLDGRRADSLDPGQVVGVLEGAIGVALLDDGGGLDVADAR